MTRKILYFVLPLLGFMSLVVFWQLAEKNFSPEPVAVEEHQWSTFKFVETREGESLDRVVEDVSTQESEMPVADDYRGDNAQNIEELGYVDHAWRIQVVDERLSKGISSAALVGVPGTWPHELVYTDRSGVVDLPKPRAKMLSNQSLYAYELLIRATQPDVNKAFWAQVRFDPQSGTMVSIDNDTEISNVHHLVLEDASDVDVHVSDEDGRPVPGAEVRLSRDAIGLVALTNTTDAVGKASFSKLPANDYVISVSAKNYTRFSEMVSHDMTAETGVIEVVLSASSGANFARNPISPDSSVQVTPRPSSMQHAQKPSASDGQRAEPDTHKAAGLLVYVADAYGGAAGDAWIELWQNEKLVFSGTAQGSQPLKVPVSAPFQGTLFAAHDGWGEGVQAVHIGDASEKDGKEVIVKLSHDLFSLNQPSERVTDLVYVEELLESELVQVGSSWLVDVLDPQSTAAKAGIARGDKLVTMRKGNSGRFELVIARSTGGHAVIRL